MHIIASILLAFSASLDSLIIGIAYGIKKIRIKFSINIIIAFIVTLGTLLSMVLGAILNKFIPVYICNYIGAILLIVVGLFMTFDFFKEQRNLNKNEINTPKENKDIIESLHYDDILINNKTADTDGSGNIEVKEAISLALALSVNNFALGLGASMSGISIPLTTIFTFIFSILILILGLKIGNSFLSKIFGKYSGLISAIIIIVMGIFQLL
ncbi:sporulation membrane protein YtaF [Clostridium saudiense]|uniref:Sporulation membrane protein YtaF n=1 Tax=Clostridium saudiense TaxID=1414720 RepID=A0ABS2FKI6_9CLOT|nr:sporulation membrane protein YtaF [Clostridium saudiense]MBM6820874.1 sporulation membrane protein YtaF [Clostridium saudiense]